MNILILAGGMGQRLWPMSTVEKPKQFHKLVSDKTMLQETYDRVQFVPSSQIYVSSGQAFSNLVLEQLPELPTENLILEPCLRDTGPCIGLAAALISRKDPEAVISIVYADHLVQDREEFQKKLKVAAEIAKKNRQLCILEVKAKSPNTNLGYVKIGKMLMEQNGVPVYEFKAFKEKPDLETAKRFMDSYGYLWNTGYYVFRADWMLEAFKKYLPETYEVLKAIQEGADINTHYEQCEKISIDYGIMEKLNPREVCIVPGDLGWSDIGTWSSLHEELTANPTSNLKKGQVIDFENEGCLFYNDSEDELVAFGLEDMIVVKSEGKIFVCPKEKSGDLKRLLQEIEKNQSR